MSYLKNTLGTLVLASSLVLGACNSNPGTTDQQVSSSTQPTAAAGTQAVPAKGFSADQINVTLTLLGAPAVSADGQNIAVNVNLANAGKVTLSSQGSANVVHLGAHGVGPDGKVVITDLARASIPDIAPGAQATVTILLPIAQVLNKSAQILPVQEGIAWFDAWGTKPLTVGPFSNCSDAAAGKVCDATGKPLDTLTATH
ncbi:hypothetical protein IMW82_08580 [Rhodanobacter sp. B2A1Ga4]|uniref:hypothetical protein n=1 Tax=Rhodanobacter sp. B2A1Ga4 TaxID=2778647 RepID=UPI001B3947B2|nr:hypothetical protein [Rhodanobacter sp. B2A1Ga4]MBQ4854725.1 hypothetical protein [Rhodanobacter sp. B2A1Ga4]